MKSLYLLIIVILTIGSCTLQQEYIARDVILYPHVLSPNGEQLAFVVLTFSGKRNDVPNYKLLLLRMRSYDANNLTDEPIMWGPIWSNDSSKLFASCSYEPLTIVSLCALDINERRTARILPYDARMKYSDLHSSISRTGDILFLRFPSGKIGDSGLSENELWILDHNNICKRLTSGLIGKATWTHDNEICLVKLDPKKKQYSFYIVDPVLEKELKVLSAVENFELFEGENAALLFRTLKDSRLSISKLDFGTLREQNIKDTSYFNYPSIAANSQQMCFIRESGLWILDLKTLEERKLTSTKSVKKYPIWTKDSSSIIYANENTALWIISSDGTYHKKIWGH